MVSIAISLILITAMVQTFNAAMQVFERGNAQLDIYSDVRSAMDVMGRDLIGMVPTGSGAQRFVLAQNVDDQFPTRAQFFGDTGDFGRDNGWEMESGTPGKLEGGAADLLGFIGRTSVRGQEQRVGLAYRIVPYQDASTPDRSIGTAVYNRALTSIQRVSIRPATTINGLKSGTSARPKLYLGPDASSGGELWKTSNAPPEVAVGYLAQNVLSFNIEVHPGNTRNGFIDLNASDTTEPHTLTDGADYLNDSDDIENSPYPLGNNSPAHEPSIPDALRFTIRFTDGQKEVRERAVQRVFWLPVD